MDYYTVTGNPASLARGASPLIRAEFALIAAGFALLPTPAAIAAGYANYVVDTGSANAYSVTPSSVTTMVDGLTLLVKFTNANTGASTLTLQGVTGGASIALVRPDGTALGANDILAGEIIQCSYSSSMGKFQLSVSSAAAVASAAASATAAASSATAAAASSTSAQNFAAALNGTSASSVAIATGAKSFTASTGKQWVAGSYLVLTSLANNANFMFGSVTSYNSGTGALVMSVLQTGGSGTFADWVISLSTALPSFAATSDIIGQVPNSGTTSGSSTAYTLTPATAISSYVANMTFMVNFHTPSGDQPTLQISGVASPPQLVYEKPDGTFANIRAGMITSAHRSKVTLLSSTQALVERLPVEPSAAGFLRNQFTGDFTVGWADNGAFKRHNSVTPHTITIPSNASAAYDPGFTMSGFVPPGMGSVTIAIAGDTLIWLGSGSTGSRTCAANGGFTITKSDTTEWTISGANLT